METSKPAEESIRVRIRGQVQGVWFRGWTEREAGNLGLSGWVRNCPDGSVEALFCGRKEAVQEMIENCASGPRLARVDEVYRAIVVRAIAERRSGSWRTAGLGAGNTDSLCR